MKALAKHFLLAQLLLAGFSIGLQAQDMPRTVIGSSGDYFDNLLFGNLHFTVGEIAVAHYQNGVELGEGFHRVYHDLLVDTKDILPSSWEVNVYPNPTVGEINIQLKEGEEVQARLFAASGQLVRSQEGFFDQASIDMSDLPAGTYMLQLISETGYTGTFQILKINY